MDIKYIFIIFTFAIVLISNFSFTENKKNSDTLQSSMLKSQAVTMDSAYQNSISVDTPLINKKLLPQRTCPVMGGDINKSIYIDYKGKRIYACCMGCIDTIKKDPQKYINKLRQMGQAVEIIKNKNSKLSQ